MKSENAHYLNHDEQKKDKKDFDYVNTMIKSSLKAAKRAILEVMLSVTAD